MVIHSLPHISGLLLFLCWSLGAVPVMARAPRGTASSAVETAAGFHVVGPKDTLFGLARQYGTTVDKIKAANGLRGSFLRDGQKLRIPGGGAVDADEEPSATPDRGEVEPGAPAMETEAEPESEPQPVAASSAPAPVSHVVQSGDTLFGIAKRYGVTVKALKKANGLRGDAISRGQKLRLPGGEEPKEEGILKKAGRVVKEGVSGIFGGEEEPVETREVIPTEASIGKKAGQGKPAPAAASADESLATYLVTPYDNLEKIAQDFNTTPVRLMQLNKMGSAADLRTKKHIYVPGNGLQAKWSKAY